MRTVRRNQRFSASRPLGALAAAALLATAVLVPGTTALGATGPGIAGRAPTAARCPAPPAPPRHTSDVYRLAGRRWNPNLAIDWTVDTAGLARPGDEVADWRTAFAAAARWSGLRFTYVGREGALRSDPPRQLIEIQYLTGGRNYGTDAERLLRRPDGSSQVVDAVIGVLASLQPGFGRFDQAAPTSSPEGGVVLHELASVLGLAAVPADGTAEVMSPTFGPASYFADYQIGDVNGLRRVGVAAGCTGFTR